MKKNNKYYKVAYLGIPGSYSYIAAVNYFKNEISMIGVDSIKSVFQKVIDDDCEFGIVPLENSTTGSISESYDHFFANNLSIVGEIILYIHHYLLVKDKSDIHQIRFCYSHPQAISQCQSFLDNHQWIKPIFTSDTTSAASIIARKRRKNCCAIANKIAAKIYGLSILKAHIEGNKTNCTRFAIISKKQNTCGNKVSLIFSVKHIPGSLYKALAPYAKYGLNLTKIESRPIFNKPWEYIFFLDFEIGKKEKEAEEVIFEMKKMTNSLTILGRYEKGKIYET